jgi:Family of unknown function (DUF5302)
MGVQMTEGQDNSSFHEKFKMALEKKNKSMSSEKVQPKGHVSKKATTGNSARQQLFRRKSGSA